MAYKNLINIDCASKTEFFCRFRDFVCGRNGTYDYSSTGIGWTIHDSSYAVDEDNPGTNDWIVLYSPGESGSDDIYLHIKKSASYWEFTCYLYWDNSTHTGTASYKTSTGNAFNDYTTPNAFILSIYGDLDSFIIINEQSPTSIVSTVAGKFESPSWWVDEDIVQSISSPSSGSDVSIELPSIPEAWEVGRHVFIRDNANIEKIEIKTISGTTITADLTNSYTTPKLQEFVGYFVNQSPGVNVIKYALIANDGDINNNITMLSMKTSFATAVAPEPLNNKRFLFPLMGSNTNGFHGQIRNFYEVINTGLTHNDIIELEDGTQFRYKHLSGLQFACLKEI